MSAKKRIAMRMVQVAGFVAAALFATVSVLASPGLDGGGVVTETPSPEPTSQPVIQQQIVAEPTAEATPEPVSVDAPDGGNVDLRPELTEAAQAPDAAVDSPMTSILGFLLCAGVIVVLALLALNFWGGRSS
jgi:hypothetical protein